MSFCDFTALVLGDLDREQLRSEPDTYHDTAQVLENLEKHTKICII